MNELVNEWVKKAEGDYNTAQREIKVTSNPNWDGVCFHCQQGVEKLLKALLQKNYLKFTKIHDLAELLRLSVGIHAELNELKDDLEWLTIFSVEFRYPGETALKEDAQKAFDIMKNSWEIIYPLVKEG